MTSNLGSEEIRAASPQLHKLVAETEDRHERYLKAIGEFNKELYPVLKKSLKRDEFLGRINQIVVFLPLSDREVNNEAIVISDVIDDLLLSPDKSSH
jgi:ATP-dependent Clp protease ATP-binding subunit ClpB